MTIFPKQALDERLRNLLFMSKPALWPVWPFLPLIRRKPGQDDGVRHPLRPVEPGQPHWPRQHRLSGQSAAACRPPSPSS